MFALPQIKSWFLPAYYYATWPVREVARSVAMRSGKLPIPVLFYHRVADREPTPWTISNHEFARQIDWLARHFEVISLTEAQLRLRTGRNVRPAVCVTFDDGYAENCDRALPMLIARGLPFTYFVATQFVQGNRPFPHDLSRGKGLPVNTVEQLRALAAAGVEIGAHTRTHVDLGPIHDVRTLRDEVLGSCEDLQHMLGRRVRYFAFPFGQRANCNPAVIHLARKADLAGVCSAYGGYNAPGDDAFHLQRLHGDPNTTRLKNWLSFDPRIAFGVRRFPEV